MILSLLSVLSALSVSPASSSLSAPLADTTRKKTDSLPLARTRTIEFATSEGTWLSLDVSPDGRTIAFELMGDIYTLPIAGGQATAITSGPPFDSQPRWSPDGKRLVFLSDRDGSENVWTMNADGTGIKQVSKGRQQPLCFARMDTGRRIHRGLPHQRAHRQQLPAVAVSQGRRSGREPYQGRQGRAGARLRARHHHQQHGPRLRE